MFPRGYHDRDPYKAQVINKGFCPQNLEGRGSDCVCSGMLSSGDSEDHSASGLSGVGVFNRLWCLHLGLLKQPSLSPSDSTASSLAFASLP